MNVLGLVFGIIAIVTSLGAFLSIIPYVQWAAVLFGVLGIIFAAVGKRKKKNRTLANVGLWLSIVAIVVVLVRLLIFWIF